MDQDFHYYGTYYAARTAGWSRADASLIAKACNFIDFLSESTYAGYWRLIREAQLPNSVEKCSVVAELTSPRYTFQGGLFGSAASPEDGLWASYHFTPGNYSPPSDASSILAVHGLGVKQALPDFELRNVVSYPTYKATLNRPLSGLSRAMIEDTINCATSEERLRQILRRALGGWEILDQRNLDSVRLFKLLLLGVRCHVVADTWAHQDHAPYADDINTYWDINGGWGRQGIEYQDTGNNWNYVVLQSASKFGNKNFEAAPNVGGKLGHGWMGHFPDYSFVKYRYKAAWRGANAEALVRDNPVQYKYAWLELCSMLTRASGAGFFFPNAHQNHIDKAVAAISTACLLSDSKNVPRGFSATQWKQQFEGVFEPPVDQIDAVKEPDPSAVLPGLLAAPGTWSSRYNFFTIHVASQLYLFQIAADYQFQFVRHWLKKHEIMEFKGSWSQQIGPLSPMIADLFKS
jgi:hypothetical protein